jgi:exosortase B
MSAPSTTAQPPQPSWLTFLPKPDLAVLLVGLFIMFAPTLWGLVAHSGLWTDDEHSHGPIVLSISLWLLWKRWTEAPAASKSESEPILAWICIAVAALLYVPGRALDIIYFETGAFVWAMAAVVLLSGGKKLFKAVAFPLFFMIFMIPLPNSLIGPISDFMKLAVSTVTVDVLDIFGFPVAQSGVVISLGQYKLLVAEACAGMRTLFMLETLGVLYLNLVHHKSLLRNVVLPILIIPISFSANVIRVLILALITYYLGDEAGQGFLHGLAGMVLFMAGLIIMFTADTFLRFISEKFSAK